MLLRFAVDGMAGFDKVRKVRRGERELDYGSLARDMVARASEPEVEVIAFPTHVTRVELGRKTTLEQVVSHLAGIPMGGTDCAQPMLWALEQRKAIDTFVVYTDNETWHGNIHPHEALQRYRNRTGIPAKLIVVGMTATQFSIAKPDDFGMLDVVGFDSAAPAIMADFSRLSSSLWCLPPDGPTSAGSRFEPVAPPQTSLARRSFSCAS